MGSERQGLLSVVGTPIGNLEDITLRALRTLREADLILAEDTRHTRKLLTHHGIETRTRSFHAHSPPSVVEGIVKALAGGAWYALVTDAGTPLVSDPGRELVVAVRDAGLRVEAVPGPSAVMAAITSAGLDCEGFAFLGFLPRSGPRRRRLLDRIARDPLASVVFESPRRIRATLTDLSKVLPEQRRVAVCRELTKLHEEVLRGTLTDVEAQLDPSPRGEITLVIEGSTASNDEPLVEAAPPPSPDDLERSARAWLADGLSPRDVARRLAQEFHLPRREAYALTQRLDRGH